MFRLDIILALVLATGFSQTVAGKSFVELKTLSKVSRGQDIVFKAKILDPHLVKLRLRYRDVRSQDYKWTDYRKSADGELSAVIPFDRIEGGFVHYYIVAQKADGSVENVYGSSIDPHQIAVDRRSGDPVLHSTSSVRRSRFSLSTPVFDRFGDDEIEDQLVIFSAIDKHSISHETSMWGKLSSRIGEERVAQMGFLTLEGMLGSFPALGFVTKTTQDIVPVFSGLDARARLKLRIDSLEVYDDFDGSSFWRLDTFGLGGVSVFHRNHDVMGATGGLFGTVEVQPVKKSQILVRAGGAIDSDLIGGFSIGKRLGQFTSYWSFSLGRFDDAVRIASLMSSDLWTQSGPRPLARLQLHTFAQLPSTENAYRVSWDGRFSIESKFNPVWDARFAARFGQTFQQDYRLLRVGIDLSNEIKVHSLHVLELNAQMSFAGLLRAKTQPTFIRRCEILELSASGLIECRMAGTFSLRERWQLFENAFLISGIELAAATQEKNDLKSLLHPSFLFEISPHRVIDVHIGYSSSMRWPTFAERQKAVDIPAPEKLRIASGGLRFKMPSEYALIMFDIQGRSMWIVDVIENQAADQNQVFGVTTGLTAKLASAHQLYFGTEYHSTSALVPHFKAVVGARVNLMKWGSAYLELQEPSRFHIFYQTRPFFDHFVLESRVDRLNSDGYFNFFADLKFFV